LFLFKATGGAAEEMASLKKRLASGDYDKVGKRVLRKFLHAGFWKVIGFFLYTVILRSRLRIWSNSIKNSSWILRRNSAKRRR